MSANVNVPGSPGGAESSAPRPLDAVGPLPGAAQDVEEAEKRLKLLQDLVEQQSRLAAAARDFAEKALAERSRAEQELEKTAQLGKSAEAERIRGERERDALALILHEAQAARGKAEDWRLAAEQARRQAEAQANEANIARQRIEADKGLAEQAVQAIRALTTAQPLKVEVAESRKPPFNWSLFWSAVSSLAAVVACLFSFWATQEAAKSVYETRQATRASVLLQLLSEFASQEMLESMRRLREFREADGGASTLKERYIVLLEGKSATQGKFTLSDINNDRRRVKGFFEKLKALAEAGIIDSKMLKIRWDRSTVIYLRDVLIPFEKANVDWLFSKGHIDEEAKRRGDRFLQGLEDFFRTELE
ncbi:hypothetical protein ACLESO_03730 [Pyxidicoccus sp. 3LG]